MSFPGEPADPELPDVDERLVAPGSRYEIDDGELVYVAPADEPHARSHHALSVLLSAHRHADHNVAIDMLTRTSTTSDIAPDASIYPAARDPSTGGRQLEVLAFEIMSTESIGHARAKAASLAARGVRRIFGIDIVRRRVFEWSSQLADWSMLPIGGRIDDPTLAIPLPVAALVDAADADHAAVRAYRAQRHPEFLAEREEGRQEGRVAANRATLRNLLIVKFGPLAAEHAAILAAAPPDLLDRYLERVVTVATIEQVFEDS